MPKFIFNRLVRDKLPADYERLGQKAVYKTLSKQELLEAVRAKIIEELNEVPLGGSIEDFQKELADTQQAIDDLVTLKGASVDEIQAIKLSKLEKKGGFTGGHFVETLELSDADEWVAYYRQEPERHKEITE